MMSMFLEDFCRVLSRMTSEVIPESGSVRLLVRDVPHWLLHELDLHLDGNPLVLDKGLAVPIILVEDSSSSSLIDPANPQSGIYNLDRVTEIRNHCDRTWLAICASGTALNASNQDTTGDLGEILEAVLDESLARIFPTDRQIRHSLRKLWKLTARRNRSGHADSGNALRWQFARCLAESGGPHSALDKALAALGHPKCDGADVASAQHSKILAEASAQAETEGLGSFFGRLIDSVSDIDALNEEVEGALADCLSHLQTTSVDGASWNTRPHVGYSPLTDATTIPDWWSILDFSVWTSLLQGRMPAPRIDRRLEVVGGIEISTNSPWVLITKPDDAFVRLLENGEAAESNWSYSGNGSQYHDLANAKTQIQISDISSQHLGTFRVRAETGGDSLITKHIVAIGSHESSVFADVIGATKVGLPRRLDGESIAYESQVELPQEGIYTCVLHLADGFEIESVFGQDITPDTEGIRTAIGFTQGRGRYSDTTSFQLQSDESCTYKISIRRSGQPETYCTLTLEVSAGEEPLRSSGSEFDALMVSHVERKQAGRNITASRNDNTIFSRLGGWLLDEEESWFPASLVAGRALPSSFSGGWRRSTPLNAEGFDREIRPISEISPPDELLATRGFLRQVVSDSVLEQGGVIEAARLWELADNIEFAGSLDRYCELYWEWLQRDETATWFDTVIVHLPSANNPQIASMSPKVLLLSPMHPLRLRWQVRVQSLLAQARRAGDFCYLACELDPDSCPPYWQLLFGQDSFKFVAAKNLSSYWSVLVSEHALMPHPSESAMFDAIGLGLPGPIRTLVSAQAKGMLTEVRDLLPATSRIKVALQGAVSASDRLFDGIVDWFSDQTVSADANGATLSATHDWLKAVPLDLDVFDRTSGNAAPSSAPLASVAEGAVGAINWYAIGTAGGTPSRPDLTMHTSLKVVHQELRSPGASAVATPDLEMSLAPIWSSDGGRIQSPVANTPLVDGGISRKIADFTARDEKYFVETSFRDRQFESNASLEGFPAAGMDPAVVAHLLDDGDSYVWRYSRDTAGDDGYFVVARSDTAIIENMSAHLTALDTAVEFDEQRIKSIVAEFGKRGLDSLHAAVGGGVAAAGAIGTFVTSHVLQPFSLGGGIFPDNGPSAPPYNFLVPLDPFREMLAGINRSLKLGTAIPRPDFLALSATVDSGSRGLRLKITPVEAKCYSATISTSQRRKMLDQQCRAFSALLEKLFHPDVDSDQGQELWSLARRKLLAQMLMTGIHIRAHAADNGWKSEDGRYLATDLCSRLMNCDPSAEIDPFGRLVLIDGSSATCFQHLDTTVDPDGFRETLQISRSDAASVIASDAPLSVPTPGPSWNMAVSSAEPTVADAAPEIATELADVRPASGAATQAEEHPEAILPKEHEELTQVQPSKVGGEKEASAPTTPTSRLRIMLGSDPSGEAVVWHPFKQDSRLPNGHCVIVGQSGSGKTYTIEKIMAPQAIRGGSNIFALEFNDEFEGSTILEEEGAQRINAAHGMEFNPLVIAQEDGSDFLNVTSHVYALADVLDTTFSLGVQQVSKLRRAIRSLYEQYGIEMVANFDPASIAAWPEFLELRTSIKDMQGTDQLLGRVEVLFDTGVFRGREGTIRDLLQHTTVVALKDLPGNRVQHAVSALLLRGVYSTLAAMGPISDRVRTVVIVDEAHKVANSQPVETLIKEIRKFGGAVWLSSQEPTDFRDSVWANCASFICLRVEDVNQARLCSQKLDNNYDLVEPLRELTVGNGYIRNNHYLPFRRICFANS